MDTRQKIIAEAMTLLKQNGYHGWSYDHISKKVGIRKASIHYYFPTKDLLVAEILNIYIKDLFTRLDAITRSKCSNDEKLQQLINCYRSNYESPNEICLCTILASDYQMLAEAIIEPLNGFYEDLFQWISMILRQGIAAKEFKRSLDVESVASFIVNVLQGLLITSKLPHHRKSFEMCMKQLDRLLK